VNDAEELSLEEYALRWICTMADELQLPTFCFTEMADEVKRVSACAMIGR